MKKTPRDLRTSELQISILDFLKSYNQNLPADFPLASIALLKKFKDTHANLFTQGDSWSLDRHRKRLIDWLPRNKETP